MEFLSKINPETEIYVHASGGFPVPISNPKEEDSNLWKMDWYNDLRMPIGKKFLLFDSN